MIGVLEQGLLAGELRLLDLHFAQWLGTRWGDGRGELPLAAALLSRQVGEGHVCLDLGKWAGRAAFRDRDGQPFGFAPGRDEWLESLRRSPAVGAAGDYTPLILDGERLYLARLWLHEHRLARHLAERAGVWADSVDTERLRLGLQKLFPCGGRETDWQKVAACIAVLRKLLVISGGPGTGKTRTVTSILALILDQTPAARVALVAPTGKAAARLRESVLQARSGLALAARLIDLVPTDTSTIHRLLGARPGRHSFRHHRGNPLPLDLLIVDEASMVDLPLMAKLVDALPAHARLILLGDKDQLASVEAGSVMGDLCLGSGDGFGRETCEVLAAVAGERIAPTDGRSVLSDNVVLLQRSYRFRADSAIGALANAANAGDADKVINILGNRDRVGVRWNRSEPATLDTALSQEVLPFFQRYANCDDPERAMEVFREFRVLCVLRDGPRGVTGVNAAIERMLSRSGVLTAEGVLYGGRPIMVARNEPALDVFNGDLALLWPDTHDDGALRAYFPQPGGGVRAIHPGRLPAHETAFAMTVHKSQGSEFDRVVIVLPGQESRVLSRELFYTAVTRARESVEIWGAEALIRAAVRRRVARGSGLAERLRRR